MSKEELYKYSISKKEFFDAFSYFFPNKYPTDTILKYMDKNFKDSNKIDYCEFNYVYFDNISSNESFIESKGNKTSLLTSRLDLNRSHMNFQPKDKI